VAAGAPAAVEPPELLRRRELKASLLDAFEPQVTQNLNGIDAVVNERLRAHTLEIAAAKQRVPSPGSAALRATASVRLNDDGPWTLKLAWISPVRTRFIRGRHPDETLTFGGAELAFMLPRGWARVAPDGSATDRAIGSVTGASAPPGSGAVVVALVSGAV